MPRGAMLRVEGYREDRRREALDEQDQPDLPWDA
jgi:hypothetical protein